MKKYKIIYINLYVYMPNPGSMYGTVKSSGMDIFIDSTPAGKNSHPPKTLQYPNFNVYLSNVG